jgi:murein L,D-transpeptidase YcbB/YkuD
VNAPDTVAALQARIAKGQEIVRQDTVLLGERAKRIMDLEDALACAAQALDTCRVDMDGSRFKAQVYSDYLVRAAKRAIKATGVGQ